MSRKALVALGSCTAEDRYGVVSGNRVAAALKRRGWEVDMVHAANGTDLLANLLKPNYDLVVPVGFGVPCEDGRVYAAAQIAGLACAGPSPAAGGLMQDKDALSRFVDTLFAFDDKIRSPKGVAVNRNMSDEEVHTLINMIDPPLVIKPAFGGSSEGLSVVSSTTEAIDVVSPMLEIEGKALVQALERSVVCEVSCTVLDTETGPEFLSVVELRRDKLPVLGPEQKFGDEGLNRHIIPARIETDVRDRLESTVLRLQQAVGAIGLTRTDVLVLPKGELVILEMNGIPGLLESSIACDAAAADGIEFDELAERYALSAFLPRMEPDLGNQCLRSGAISEGRVAI